MLITIIDLETTGFDPNTDSVAEIAAVLVSVEHREILQQVSTLLPVRENGAIAINGIEPDVTQLIAHRGCYSAPLQAIRDILNASDYAVAFNSDFEEAWFDAGSVPRIVDKYNWSDAATYRYPSPSQSRSLVNLCVAHRIPIVRAHRGLDDCLLTWELMQTCSELEAEIVRGAQPKVLVKALVSFAQKDLAKAAGFHWDKADLVPRAWAKRALPDELEDLPFEVEVVG